MSACLKTTVGMEFRGSGAIYMSFVTTLNVDVADWMASDFPTSSHPN